ncbi:hypothetical protein V9K92_01275 [Phyllobacterium sp. CCNWLW109]|uniref:hypothetical protein n=1 Tax=Phyllobacterium sp. CCNWLW109 TaxID=3127479 RepID=UPI0030771174
MNTVTEAEKLPDRHWYAYEEEMDDEDAVADGSSVEEVGVETDQAIDTKNSFERFLSSIVDSAKVYGELVAQRTGDARIDRHLRNLRMIKATQAYGFLMHLRTNGTKPKVFIEVLQLTENFILVAMFAEKGPTTRIVSLPICVKRTQKIQFQISSKRIAKSARQMTSFERNSPPQHLRQTSWIGQDIAWSNLKLQSTANTQNWVYSERILSMSNT